MRLSCRQIVSEQENTKQVEFTVDNTNVYSSANRTPSDVSENYILCNAAVFRVKVTTITNHDPKTNDHAYHGSVYIMFAGLDSEVPLSYTLNISCDKWNIVNKKLVNDDGFWRLIGETTGLNYSFTITAEMTLTPTKSIFEDLFNDDELVDFELKGEDGSVKMHRTVLAGVSPVLRRMLSGTWREAAEGSVDVTGTSVMTLNHFKEYIYLQKLPVVGLEQLLLLAHYYMMPELENRCIVWLLKTVTAQNAYELVKWGAKYDITALVLAIFGCIERGSLKVKDMKEVQLGLENTKA